MGEMLYLDCSAGASGDMLAAALIDAGASEQAVMAALRSLPVEGFEAKVSRVEKSGLSACDFAVVLDAAHDGHDHDMAYLYGTDAPEPSAAYLGGEPHAHRHLADVLAIVDAGELSEGAREVAHRIFGILAEAEAAAHGVPVEQVHFHEVGAVDSIADVVAIAVAFDALGLREVAVPWLAEGHGTVRCQHGLVPVPVPAVVNIAQAHGLPLSVRDVEGELVTPTGAAAIAALRTTGELPAAFRVNRVGMGAGKRDYPTSGLLRALVIEPEPRR